MQGNAFFFAWEEQMLLFFQSFMGGIWESAAKFFTMVGEELIPVAIVAFIYWCIDKRLAKRIGYSVMLASLGFPMIKNIALRLRPYMVHEGVACLKPVVSGADINNIAIQGYSFPSGHSAMSASTYGAIGAFVRRSWAVLLAVLLPLMIGISRVCLGVHYPTDVLAGWAVGYISVMLALLMERYIKKDLTRFALLFVLALPGVFYCRSDDYFSALGLLIGLAGGVLYEQKYVNFAATRRPLVMVIRTVAGLLLYLGLTTGMKMLFAALVGTTGAAAFVMRVIRYAVCVFLLIGIYPRTFALIDRWLPVRTKKAGS